MILETALQLFHYGGNRALFVSTPDESSVYYGINTEAGRRYGTQWESLNKQMIGAFGTAFDDRHGWEILLHGIVGHEGE